MTRISISINSYDAKKPGATQSYNVSFDGKFSEVRKEIDKIYAKFKTKVIQRKEGE